MLPCRCRETLAELLHPPAPALPAQAGLNSLPALLPGINVRERPRPQQIIREPAGRPHSNSMPSKHKWPSPVESFMNSCLQTSIYIRRIGSYQATHPLHQAWIWLRAQAPFFRSSSIPSCRFVLISDFRARDRLGLTSAVENPAERLVAFIQTAHLNSMERHDLLLSFPDRSHSNSVAQCRPSAPTRKLTLYCR